MPSQSQNPRTGAPPALVYAQPLNVCEAAEWLGVSAQTVYRMINAGRIKAVNRNHHWFISQKALADYAYGPDVESARKGGMKAGKHAVRAVDVAAYLGISYDSVLQGAKNGRIPGAKVGGVWLFSPRAIKQMLGESD